jgi:hypothetical protein
MNEKELDNLCGTLTELLRHELEKGNRVAAVETGWSRVKLAVRLARPLDIFFIKKAAQNNPDLEIWESRDIKNPQETGVLCKSAQQTLSGPIERPDVR